MIVKSHTQLSTAFSFPAVNELLRIKFQKIAIQSCLKLTIKIIWIGKNLNWKVN